MGMLDDLKAEMDNAPSGGDFWKPMPGTYKVTAGKPTFEDRKFTRESDGKEITKRQCRVPTKIHRKDQPTEDVLWTFNVSKSEKSVCHEFVNAATVALQEGAKEGEVPLIVEVKGEGLDRVWSVYSVEGYRQKMEAARDVLG